MDIEQARFNMIEQQIRPWDVLDTRVLNLIQSVPRELFVSDSQQGLAFADMEIPIGHDQVMMSPKVEARMLQSLEISTDDSILEIGTGSGFITSCLAKLGNHVTTCEYFEDLSEHAKTRLQQQDNIDFLIGDIFNLTDTLKQYDVIAVTGSTPEIVNAFTKLLNINGRLFSIIGQAPAMTAKLITCVGENSYREEGLFETHLPALISTSTEKVFSF
ncbi:MAG: protein-L-isoaspartate O-methyltransferase [Gammaproteobacteria bacterium]|nr:protein-L-isoaspartate O-methyltransferase [Gammaproteobacteria bacterium]